MLQRRQKALLHIYAGAAGINQATYRNILTRCAGAVTAADPHFSQGGFDRCMAALEAILFDRVRQNAAPNPIGHNRHIRSEYYWRRRAPAPGAINSRQLHEINSLWARLCEWLDPAQCTPAYVLGIAARATGRPVESIAHLRGHEAASLLDALRDRLGHAIAAGARTAVEEEVPF